jgi:hypothetical protein
MSSAVLNLQRDIASGQKTLTQLLRETKLIAAKLNLADVEQWVDYELEGYPKDVDPPKYRTYYTESIQIRNPVHGWIFAGHMRLPRFAHESIAELENLSRGEDLTSAVAKNFPVTDGLGMGMASQWPQRVVFSSSQMKTIIEAIRNELLKWSIELERRGIKGEDMSFNEQEKQSAAKQVFNIGTVHGMVGNISNSQVTLYDYSSIQQLLVDRQIPKQDRRELEDIMDELKTAPPDKKQGLLEQAKAWVVKHKDFLGAAAEAVGKAIGEAIK